VPKVTVITRKAYGGAYDVVSSNIRGDVNYARPTAEIAAMQRGGRDLISRRDRKAKIAARGNTRTLCQPVHCGGAGYIDEVILPAQHAAPLPGFNMLRNKTVENPGKARQYSIDAVHWRLGVRLGVRS
jgi:acetyl-CoA carboxylase carboxyltransferase component